MLIASGNTNAIAERGFPSSGKDTLMPTQQSPSSHQLENGVDFASVLSQLSIADLFEKAAADPNRKQSIEGSAGSGAEPLHSERTSVTAIGPDITSIEAAMVDANCAAAPLSEQVAVDHEVKRESSEPAQETPQALVAELSTRSVPDIKVRFEAAEVQPEIPVIDGPSDGASDAPQMGVENVAGTSTPDRFVLVDSQTVAQLAQELADPQKLPDDAQLITDRFSVPSQSDELASPAQSSGFGLLETGKIREGNDTVATHKFTDLYDPHLTKRFQAKAIQHTLPATENPAALEPLATSDDGLSPNMQTAIAGEMTANPLRPPETAMERNTPADPIRETKNRVVPLSHVEEAKMQLIDDGTFASRHSYAREEANIPQMQRSVRTEALNLHGNEGPAVYDSRIAAYTAVVSPSNQATSWDKVTKLTKSGAESSTNEPKIHLHALPTPLQIPAQGQSVPFIQGTPTTQPHSPVWLQIIEGFSKTAGGNISVRTELALAPEDLGRVRLEVSTLDDKTTVRLFAERTETLDYLRRSSDSLVTELRQLGLQQATLSFGSWNENRSSKHSQLQETEAAETVSTANIPPSPSPGLPPDMGLGRLHIRL